MTTPHAQSAAPWHGTTILSARSPDKVVVIGEATWLVKSTGRTYDIPWVNVFTLRDGKILRVEAYHDTAPAERAFRPDRPDQMAAATALRH